MAEEKEEIYKRTNAGKTGDLFLPWLFICSVGWNGPTGESTKERGVLRGELS
jgi:hypothetical protein